jgi:hypothetical protein
VGVSQHGFFRACLDAEERIFELYSELIPVWKMGRGIRTNVGNFYLPWNEDFGGKVWRQGA